MSFAADSRFRFLDVISPDEPEHQIEAAIFLSYSADMPSIFAVLLTLLGLDLSVREVEDPLSELESYLPRLVALKDRVRILINPGGMNRHRLKNPILAGAIDQIVREVHLKPGSRASFHPKVALMRFSDQEGGSGKDSRLIVSSRNMTVSLAMDMGASSQLKWRGKEVSSGAGVVEFLEQALRTADERESPPEAIRRLLEDARNSSLGPNGGDESWPVKFVCQTGAVGSPSFLESARLAEYGTERIVISPFLDLGGLRSLITSEAMPRRLISTPEALAKIATSDGGRALLEGVECYVLNLEGIEDFEGLHAKVVIDRFHDRTRIVSGSANATGAGLLGRNWEAGFGWDAPVDAFELISKDLFESEEGVQPLARRVELGDFTEGPEPEDIQSKDCQYALREMPLTGRISLLDGDVRLEVIAEVPEILEGDKLSVTPFGRDVWTQFSSLGEGRYSAAYATKPEELSLFCHLRYELPDHSVVEMVRRLDALISDEILAARESALFKRLVNQKGLAALLLEFMSGGSFGGGLGGGRGGGRRGEGDDTQHADQPSLEGFLQFVISEPGRVADFERLLALDGLEGQDAELLARLRRMWGDLRSEITRVRP